MLSLSGRSSCMAPAMEVVPTPSLAMPNLPSVRSKVGMIANTPMEPVIVTGLDHISSASINNLALGHHDANLVATVMLQQALRLRNLQIIFHLDLVIGVSIAVFTH